MLRRVCAAGLSVSIACRASPQLLPVCESLQSIRHSGFSGGDAYWERLGPTISRGFASSSPELPAPSNNRVHEAHSLLQRLSVRHLKEQLAAESESSWHLPYPRLLQLCEETGAAQDQKEAEHVCEALDTAGVVIRVRDLVYLRPADVAQIVFEALPDTEAEYSRRLNDLLAEFQPLQLQKEEADRRALRWSHGAMYGGLALLLLQWGVVFRLTFFELSWDVIEPVTYFVTSAFGIGAYAYFLWFHEEFDYHRCRNQLASRFQNTLSSRKGFDVARYEQLLSEIRRFERVLARKNLPA